MSKTWGVVAIIIMLLLSLLFLSGSGLIRFSLIPVDASAFPHLQSLFLNRQGNRQLKTQNYQAAFDAYVSTLKFEPFSAETHLNLGLSFEGQQQPANAMPSYKNALKYAKDDLMKFMAYFNQAQLLGKEKKVDEALELYQKALDIESTSKEVKTNIELLIQLQQQNGQGGESQQDQNQKDQEQKDQNQKDQNQKDQSQKNQDPKNQPQDPQDQDQDEKDKKDKKENPQYAPNQKHKPRPFKGKELSEGDVKKILGEIRQQEQKIRSEYNRKEVKEQPRDKDW